MNKPIISHIVAISENRVIGKDNDLIWKLPKDHKRYKELTMGHPLIMGRKTFESIGRPLPGRTNIVVTRDPAYNHEGVIVTHSIDEAIQKAKEIDNEEIFINGGGQIYTETLHITDKIYLTLVHQTAEGTVYYPEYKNIFTKELFREDNEENGVSYSFIDLAR